MSEAIERLRRAMRLAAGLGQAVELLSMSWVLLGAGFGWDRSPWSDR
jgi:hypothetical protein